eukprot:5398550-Pleurochrysis_carterae.AAC.3
MAKMTQLTREKSTEKERAHGVRASKRSVQRGQLLGTRGCTKLTSPGSDCRERRKTGCGCDPALRRAASAFFKCRRW